MKTRRIPLAIAVAAALLTPSTAAWAAALGEVASLSALGEGFRAEIRLVGDGTVQPSCFRVVAPANPAAGIPALAGGRVSIVGTGSNARLVVRADRAVHDPVLQLALENVCETRLRREYTLLMPFTAANAVSAPATAAPAREPAATRTAPAAPRSAPPRPAKPRPQKAAVRTWSTAAGESLASLGEALYPDDLAARARFSEATAAANPRLFPNAASHSRPLPAGTRVVIPNLRQAGSTAPGKATTPSAASPAPALAAQDTEDRVVVNKLVAPTAGTSLAPRTAGGSGNATAGDDRVTELLGRERELAAAIDRSIIAEMELLARIKELEELQAGLEARLRGALAAAPQATAAQAGSIAPTTATAPVVPAAPDAAAPSATSENDVYLFAGLGIAALLLAALLLRRRRGEQPITVPPTAGSATYADDLRASARPATPDTVPHAGFADEVIDTATDARTITPAANTQVAGNGTVVEEHKSAVELADIMISFGRVHGAAETLAEFIRGNPREAVTPWLKLLEVYRAAGQRAEFDTIANELNKTFNVTTVNWDNYQTLRAVRTSLEDLPHIIETLQKSWRTPACQRYLQQLLRDNRDGTRVGFPFPVIDEILTLSAILEEELGPCPRTNDKAQARR